MPNNVTEKTHQMVQGWIHARKRVESLKSELNSAECALANSANELGQWLVPEDQNGEPFNIWFGSGILEAKRSKDGMQDYAISWRKKPDGKDALEFGA